MDLENDIPQIAFDVYGYATYQELKKIFDGAFKNRQNKTLKS